MKKLIALLVLGLAFSVGSPRLAVADAGTDKIAERAVLLIESMANIVDANKTNCDKMGVSLDKFADATAAERAELKSYKDKLTEEQKRAYVKKYGARLQAAAGKIMGGMQTCGTNAKVKAAMTKLADTAG